MAELLVPQSTTGQQPRSSSSTLIPVTVAAGDGIGPEITAQVLRILEAAGAPVQPEFIEVGEQVYRAGHTAGIAPEAWDSLHRTRVLLKGPITTPQGGGYKSLNVTLRKTLGLYANVRPCRSLHPAVATLHPKLDVVIIRENEEDLYAGIEHQHTPDVVQCLKLITRTGCERIVRYAFEYARRHGRRKVTCMTKDNIMKLTDGLFHRVFDEIGREYPDMEQEHQIIDIGTARLATQPARYDVVVTLNLYGDIISDVVAELTGSVGLAGSANIGRESAMFEAIHGSAPDIAGQGVANPSGMLQAAVLMLQHLGQHAVAANIQNAWLHTLEDGLHPADIFRPGHSRERVSTAAFADAIIARLGLEPGELAAAQVPAAPTDAPAPHPTPRPQARQELVGIDVFLRWDAGMPDELGAKLEALAAAQGALQLKLITNRGVKVYPQGQPETYCTDHWRCRFVATGELPTIGAGYHPVFFADALQLQLQLTAAGLHIVKTENLYLFDGQRGFSLGQGE
ncbi:NADP-dependent isocitrate dehydrogenase [Hymenobacter sp. 15J16-1T3B]|uniref:NADP-dependent isocitrate dehydrogenase n=1 Tax=Hymenobacter sp. 15J16-1T3B TaxID=2886941 RepID=UPI001D12D479|nr:NADP-dependent isocitrate dehydrogenase [Hymenobacter sp. 15J16-1T3B]MCC3159374.1 NADP-dependent isocitrate dehydrogenase [Hymenobacter sp. 15J16-1T3B]